MASADIDVTVAVEQAIHTVLREAIQNISDQHHIRVTDLHIKWYATRALGFPPEFKVETLTATTESGD